MSLIPSLPYIQGTDTTFYQVQGNDLYTCATDQGQPYGRAIHENKQNLTQFANVAAAVAKLAGADFLTPLVEAMKVNGVQISGGAVEFPANASDLIKKITTALGPKSGSLLNAMVHTLAVGLSAFGPEETKALRDTLVADGLIADAAVPSEHTEFSIWFAAMCAGKLFSSFGSPEVVQLRVNINQKTKKAEVELERPKDKAKASNDDAAAKDAMTNEGGLPNGGSTAKPVAKNNLASLDSALTELSSLGNNGLIELAAKLNIEQPGGFRRFKAADKRKWIAREIKKRQKKAAA